MQKKIGSGVGMADWAVVVLAVLLYFKTAEVLSYFAPQNVSAFAGMDVAWIYGMITALFVEGVAIAFHFHPGARRHTPAKIVMWILIIISGICQVFDGKMVTDAISSMPEQQQVIFNYGVPLLPWFVIILLFMVGRIPDANEDVVHTGFKNRLPNVKRWWNGDEGENTVVSPSQVVQANLQQNTSQNNPPASTPANGQNSGVTNPTNRQP